MERYFAIDHRWVWILNGIVTFACFVSFLIVDGKERVYSFYIPLDFALNIAKSAFFWYHFHQDHKIKAEKVELAKRLHAS